MKTQEEVNKWFEDNYINIDYNILQISAFLLAFDLKLPLKVQCVKEKESSDFLNFVNWFKNDYIDIPECIKIVSCGHVTGIQFSEHQVLYNSGSSYYVNGISTFSKKQYKLIKCDKIDIKVGDIFVTCDYDIEKAKQLLCRYYICLENNNDTIKTVHVTNNTNITVNNSCYSNGSKFYKVVII